MHALCCRFPGSAAASSFAATATRRQVAIVKRLREIETGYTALRYVNPVLAAVAFKSVLYMFSYLPLQKANVSAKREWHTEK